MLAKGKFCWISSSLKDFLTLLWKIKHKESGVYNSFWRCSNEQAAQKIYERILKRVRPFNSWGKHSTTDEIEPFPCKGCLSPKGGGVAPVKRWEHTSAHKTRSIKKSSGYILGGTTLKHSFIRDHRVSFPVSLMSQALEVWAMVCSMPD